MRGNFSNDSFEFENRPSSLDARFAPPVFARVTEVLPRFRANVITTFGEPFKNIRYFGPALSQNGNAHGRAFSLKKDQMVLLEFIGGSYRSPVITKGFSFPTMDSDLSNLNSFWEKYPFLDPEKDIIDFHESGFCVRQTTNKIEVYDSGQQIVFELDFESKKGKLNLSSLEISGDLKINGNVDITGDTTQTGKIKATGKIESDEGLVSSGTEFNEHGHAYSPGPLAQTKSGPPI
ncbi:FapA family protein [Leptospira sanjuanensis]|uniref:FapA family protein n=1 Tax=Leptospira sanjuanensis TaxID=2879643 RepID=UPI001EE8BEC3|nr:FapA family protein [Leptospira sanjuanensis]MCG6170238.1 FapA family protein [Leptospira sanjuanensis]